MDVHAGVAARVAAPAGPDPRFRETTVPLVADEEALLPEAREEDPWLDGEAVANAAQEALDMLIKSCLRVPESGYERSEQ